MKLGISIVLMLAVAGCGKKDSSAPAEKGGTAGTADAAKVAKLTVDRLAFEGYPMWAASHPDKACPDTLADLTVDLKEKTTKDPWGTELQDVLRS